MRLKAAVLLAVLAGFLQGAEPDAKEIIQKSVQANQRDFEADPHYNYKERDLDRKGDRTFQVTMIEGSPYSRLIALNGQSLSADQEREEVAKEAQERKRRSSESTGDRQKRLRKYERDRERDHAMLSQLTKGFNFTLQGQRQIKGHSVWVLHATPRRGYTPPNRDSQVLTGMQGELWVDQKTFQWVRVSAQVVQPVSIEGFLARVEPGTHFELEKVPVGNGSYWGPSHFSQRANARIIGLFNHREHEDNTFWDYEPVK
jgi:hypothetical protein